MQVLIVNFIILGTVCMYIGCHFMLCPVVCDKGINDHLWEILEPRQLSPLCSPGLLCCMAVWLSGASAEKLGRAGPCHAGGQPWARPISWAEGKLGSYRRQTITRASQGYKSDAISHGLTCGLLSVNKSRKKLKVHKVLLVKCKLSKPRECLNSQWMWDCCGPRYDLGLECRFEGSMCIIIIVEGQLAYWRGSISRLTGSMGIMTTIRSTGQCLVAAVLATNPVNKSTSANPLRPNYCHRNDRVLKVFLSPKSFYFSNQLLTFVKAEQCKVYAIIEAY